MPVAPASDSSASDWLARAAAEPRYEVEVEQSDDAELVFSHHLWRQRIALRRGLVTPGKFLASGWAQVGLPERLDGISFLDVGANDGLFAFIAEQRGASRVAALDLYVDSDASGAPATQDMTGGWPRFPVETCRGLLRSRVEVHPGSVYELDHLRGQFDYVYCSNVIPWLRDPLRALESLAGLGARILHVRDDVASTRGGPALRLVKRMQRAAAAPASAATREQACLYHANRAFYRAVLGQFGYTAVALTRIDERRALAELNAAFPFVEVPRGVARYRTPWAREAFDEVSASRVLRSTMRVGSRVFVQSVGWLGAAECPPWAPRPLPRVLLPLRHARKRLRALADRLRHPYGRLPNFSIVARRR